MRKNVTDGPDKPVRCWFVPIYHEEGFSVQRLIVAQTKQDFNLQSNDQYSGTVLYKPDGTGNAPWFDWGPYLWASATSVSSKTGLFWCNGQAPAPCNGAQDVRYGVLGDQMNFWGDFTHPTYTAIGKVADKIVDFLTNTQNPNRAWVAPWIGQ